MTKMLPAEFLRNEISALRLRYPEIDEDEVFREDMIVGSTNVADAVTLALSKIHEAQDIAHGARARIAYLRERIEHMERREHAARELIMKLLNWAELKKLTLTEATVSVRPGQPHVIVTDERILPQDFWRVKREPDKQKIGAALKAHEQVPGCVLSNPEQTIAVSVR